jgi:hypothetical protein
MLYEYVFVKELKSGEVKTTQRKYPIIVSQSGEIWRLFNNEHVEINHAYTIGYEKSEDGQYKNIKSVIPLQNVWLQQALKEVSSKSDICKNVSVSTGYAKDLCAGGIIDPTTIFEWADKIYDYIAKKTDSEYDKINNSGIPNLVR